MNNVADNPHLNKVLTVDGFVQSGLCPFSRAALRHLIFKSKPRLNSKGESLLTNGLSESGAIIKIGRKILIDVERFDSWIVSHRL